MNPLAEDRFNFSGSYWSSGMFSLFGYLALGCLWIIVMIIALICYVAGAEKTGLFLFLVPNIAIFLRYAVAKKSALVFDETILTRYEDSRPKTKVVKQRDDTTGQNTFVYGMDEAGKERYQLRMEGRFGIGHTDREQIHLVVDSISPAEFLACANKYWKPLPIDKNAAVVTIEGFTYPDTPRPDFYFNVYLWLQYDTREGGERRSSYTEPIEDVLGRKNTPSTPPPWWPTALSGDERRREADVAAGYRELEEFKRALPTVKIRSCWQAVDAGSDRYVHITYGPVSIY